MSRKTPITADDIDAVRAAIPDYEGGAFSKEDRLAARSTLRYRRGGGDAYAGDTDETLAVLDRIAGDADG